MASYRPDALCLIKYGAGRIQLDPQRHPTKNRGDNTIRPTEAAQSLAIRRMLAAANFEFYELSSFVEHRFGVLW